MTITVTTAEAQKGFYPTPPALAEKLIDGIAWEKHHYALEPSAGTGNLLYAMGAAAKRKDFYRWGDHKLEVDCIEIDPGLRYRLEERFSEESYNNISKRLNELERKRRYDHTTQSYIGLSEEEKSEVAVLSDVKATLKAVNVRIVHDNFLSYESRKNYDLIVMNPPFADGDAHLLKALSLLEYSGGEIRCLLNAETLRNPYTKRRILLAQKLDEYGAKITYEQAAFADADRPTMVEVAIVAVTIPAHKWENDPEMLYSKLKSAAELDEPEQNEITDLTMGDFVHRIVSQYNFETDVGIRLIREYTAMRPYILDRIGDKRFAAPILQLSVNSGSRNSDPCINDFIQQVRRKYWNALFSNEQFVGKLTSDLLEKYRSMVSQLVNYDFSVFNIQRIYRDMNAEISTGVVETIMRLFDEMTVKHTWSSEYQKNIHYYTGWASNKAHKISGKVILPCYGLFYDYESSCGIFRTHDAYCLLSDIEKSLNYLDGNMTAEVDLANILNCYSAWRVTKNIPCKFFEVTFYKKGTCHIKFTNQELLDRFNIFCARQRGWLPPSYGRKHYTDLTAEEKQVVDSFHGDNTEGSGEQAYEAVVAKASYYLAAPNHEVLTLPDATA